MAEFTPWKLKQLLQDIEGTGASQDKVNLLAICKEQPRIYGNKGNKERRELQKKFSYIKAQSIGNYVKLLDKSSVVPSSKTQQLLREDKAAAEEESEDSDSDHHESSFGNLSLQEYSGKEDHSLLSPTLSPTLSPASFLSPSSMGTPIRSNAIFSSPPQLNPISSPEPSMTDSSSSHTTWNFGGREEGTQDKPYIIHVDMHHPERNREFDIERVSGITHNSYD
jgi:hypothetical protein